MITLENTFEAIRVELKRGIEKHGVFNSTHEAYGVMAEEVDELNDEFKKLLKALRSNDLQKIRDEAIQVASCAVLLAAQCNCDIPFPHKGGTK